MPRDIGKQIALLEKKIDHSSNDITRLIIKDVIQMALEANNINLPSQSTFNSYIDDLIDSYKDALHEFRLQEKVKNRQMEIMENVKSGGSGPIGMILKSGPEEMEGLDEDEQENKTGISCD